MCEWITEKNTVWEYLQTVKKPIFLYGMGYGADKILAIFRRYGILASGVFASDEFVRGHSFHHMKVRTLAEIEAENEDFVIVLAFAAGYRELYDKIFALSKKHELLAPDLPVVGDKIDGEIFDTDFLNANAEKIERVYSLLADEQSRKTYADVINFKISGKIDLLDGCTINSDSIWSEIIRLSDDETYVDLGAYNGDTVMEFIGNTGGNYNKIYAFEPNVKNYGKLVKNTENIHNITLYHAAAFNTDGFLMFPKNEGRMAKNEGHLLGELDECQTNGVVVPCYSLDGLIKENATLIKLDVEGAEKVAILGAERHIRNGAKIICSLYHRVGDLFELPLLIHEMNPKLKLYVRHHLYIPAWETNLYGVES